MTNFIPIIHGCFGRSLIIFKSKPSSFSSILSLLLYLVSYGMPNVALANETLQTKEQFSGLNKTKGLKNQHRSTTSVRKKQVSQSTASQIIRQGNQISLNGRTMAIAWSQWPSGKSVRTGISDTGLMQRLGLDLLNTNNFNKQPIQWFSDPRKSPQILDARLRGSYRYLDITNFAQQSGWQLKVDNDKLLITSVPAIIKNINVNNQIERSQIIVDLDRPTPWRISNTPTESTIFIEGSANPELLERFAPPPINPPTQPLTPPTPLIKSLNSSSNQTTNINSYSPNHFDKTRPLNIAQNNPLPSNNPNPQTIPTIDEPQPIPPLVESKENQTIIRLNIPAGWRSNVSSTNNPHQLIIDIAPDALVERDILWAPGLRWRQQFVTLGASRFPVVWLEINLRQRGLMLKPIWSNPSSLVGITPLMQTAPIWQASAAINAGFFNRKVQLPLGAIRQDNRWLSSPILNRGAIAWNNQGDVKMARLTLQESLITPNQQRLPILFLNSGYVQTGIARYNPDWGKTYTPLTNDEILVTVQNNQVTGQLLGGIAGETPFPIPSDGYLLTIRNNPTAATLLPIGTNIQIESSTIPSEFSRYPNILGAGPLLVQNGQIVLDAKAETFRDEFIKENAIRSAIATTSNSKIIIAAVHNRVGGSGPNLTEIAQIMQSMGAIDALNLDGGSSTSLYLGGELINRSSATAARVHNSLGIFLQSP